MSTKRAAAAFEAFTGHKASKVAKAKLDDRDVTGWKLGPAVGVAYEATRDGETRRYFHEFGKKARPDLVARDDGRQLYFAGGRYQVTDRGIEDMPSLFVVNPSPRVRRAPAKKRKPAAMARTRRSTRRRPARQMAGFRANPAPRRRRRRARAPTRRRMYARNPARRSRRTARRGIRRFRRNPSLRGGAISFGKLILPAAGIGLGAVGSEIIMGYLPIPANLKTGVMRHITKGAVGIAAGLVIGKLLKQKRLGNYFALGAVAIAVHDAVKETIAARMPSIPFGMYTPSYASSLGGMGYTSPGQTMRLGQFVDPIASSLQGVTGGETDFSA